MTAMEAKQADEKLQKRLILEQLLQTPVTQRRDATGDSLAERVRQAADMPIHEFKLPKDNKALPTLADSVKIESILAQINPWVDATKWGRCSFNLVDATNKLDEKKKTAPLLQGWSGQFHTQTVFEIRHQDVGFLRFVPLHTTDGKPTSGLVIASSSESTDGHALSLDFINKAIDAMCKQWPFAKSFDRYFVDK